MHEKRRMFLDFCFRYCVYEIIRPPANEQASENSVEATWREMCSSLARVLYILSVCVVASLEACRNLVCIIVTAEDRHVKE